MLYLQSFLIVFFISLFSNAQELPPIDVFTPHEYDAENQNWAISQGSNNHIYLANNKGLLEYNGEVWQLYNSPNETIMRSVKVIGDRIYTGSYMEFGYWTRSHKGKLIYTSLLDDDKIRLKEDEQIWNIISLDNWILFQSLNNIYVYNSLDESFKVIESKNGITKSFLLDDGSIYYQDIGLGIFEIKNGKSSLVLDSEVVKKEKIINVFSDHDGYLILTQNKGFYHYNPNTKRTSKWTIDTTSLINKVTVYNGLRLSNGNYMLGTISNGILILNNEGELQYHISQDNGLNNNTILSAFEDVNSNLWLGLDNGINCINMNSSLRIYNDEKGDLGTVYASLVYKDKLYLGTNQGLFFKEMNSKKAFSFVEDTQGQVWSLDVIDNVLFCGHNMGTYVVDENKVNKVANIQGTWSVKKIKDRPNLLIQGNYDGLHILEKLDEKWNYRNKINGFNISSRFFELIDNKIFVNHEYKGIFKIEVNEDFTNAVKYGCDATLKGAHSGLISYNEDLLYAFRKGIYKYDQNSGLFKKDSLLSNMYSEGNYISGKLINDKKGDKLWGFTNSELVSASPGKFSKKPDINRVKISDFLEKGVTNYESLLNLGNQNYLFGTSSGYVIVNTNKPSFKEHKVNIECVYSGSFNAIYELVDVNLKSEFKSDRNSFQFDFAAPYFEKNTKALYQHKLEGINKNWNKWSKQHFARYENLPYGDYIFKVRSKRGDQISINEAIYKFTIKRPWYLTVLAKVTYVVLLILVIYMFNRAYLNYHQDKKEKTLQGVKNELSLKELENAQQLMSFENEKLLSDIDNKNRELAISTMSLIKKNEFLNTIKKELISIDSNLGVKKVINIIDKNINNTDDWQFFQQAFNNADKDFLHKVKTKHPTLTPNDLKLCAYLRLNLSSKEIAPLLNISSRSVEVKRYRLRKKMNLKHEESLTSHILEI